MAPPTDKNATIPWQQLHCNRGAAFSMQSVLRCYEQNKQTESVSEVEWSGVEWSGVEWSGVEWSGVEWSGVEWSGVEWSGVS
jgi:hypothetical protein